MSQPIPIVIIVGFLGAGKTTLLKNLLPQVESAGIEPYVIINDYTNAKVDALSLEYKNRSVTPINGNCICCDSLIELMNLLVNLSLSDRSMVFVEANGTTDPTVLIEHLLGNEELRQRYAPILQLTVVDIKRWQKRFWMNELERLQIETASHLLFTREETSSAKRITKVAEDIATVNARATCVDVTAFAEELASYNQASNSTAEHVDEGGVQVISRKKDDDRHAHAHAFVGMELKLPDPMPAKSLQDWLNALPDEVLRAKGIVRFSDEPDRWFQFQYVEASAEEAKLYPLPAKPVVPACAVLIGVKLNQEMISELLSQSMDKAKTDV